MAKRKVASKRKSVTKRKVVKKASAPRKRAAPKKRVVKKSATKRSAAKKGAVKKSPVKRKTKRASVLSQTSYTLSPELATVVGTKTATRPQIVKKLWVYIKAKKLQDANNRRMIVPDDKLSAVIGKRPVDMLKLASHLNKHIQS